MRGDAPKGQGGVRITINNAYSPGLAIASATPLINEGGKNIFSKISKKGIDQTGFLGYTQQVWIMIIHNYVLLRVFGPVEHR